MDKPVADTLPTEAANADENAEATATVKSGIGKTNPNAKHIDQQIRCALAKICTLHKLPYSDRQAVFGLPTQDGLLTLALIERAAANLKIKGEMRREDPTKLSGLLFPCIVFSKAGGVGVAVENDAGRGTITLATFDKEGNENVSIVPIGDIDRDHVPIVVLTTPMYLATDNASDLDHPRQQDEAWFWPVVRRFWPNWSYVIIATLIINLLGLALPLFVLNVYDKVIPNESIPTLWALIGGVGIALFFDFILRLLRAGMIDNSGERVDLAVSANLFSRAMDVRMAERQLNAGQISNQVREFDSVRDFFSSSALTSLIDIVFIGIFLGLLWFIVGELALVPIIAVPIVILVTLLIQLPLKRSVERNQAAATNRHSVLVDAMVGIETVKAISAEGVLQKRWEKSVASSAAAGVAMRFWSSFAVYFTMFAQQIVSVIVITWGVFLVIDGAITIGALIASNILVGRILSPLGSTASTLMRLQQSMNAYRQISELMRLDRENRQSPGVFTEISRGMIEARNVSFAYPGQTSAALNNFSMQIQPGEKIGIIGRVGSGKSTIGKLLSGLYNQNEGEILIDGTDTRKYAVADLRSAIGYVSQETELFSGSLRENILLAHPERADRLEECIKVSGVAAFAGAHPLGLEMNVGERGRFLSGGQRQAVGLARMMISDPKVIYLDEPTSQIDTTTENLMISGYAKWLSPEQTIIIATHRHSLLSLVDRLIVLDGGKVIADGPKDQVLDKLGGKNTKSNRKRVTVRET